jgi:hypothetical protein
MHKENEMRVQIIKVIAVSLLISISQIAVAFSDESMGNQTVNKYERWQMSLIYQPSQSTLDREGRGFVHIYDGFTDTQVNQIMDDKFERIDNMMFTSVKITDTEGAVLKDPMTGYELVEDDGCD